DPHEAQDTLPAHLLRHLTATEGAARCCRSSTRYGQDRHYLHGFAWEDCKVRVVFEKLRGGLIRFRSDDREGSHVVAYVFDAALSDLLGLTEWSTHGDDRALVLFDPCLPRGH